MAVNPEKIFNREDNCEKCFQIKKYRFVIIPDFGNTFQANDENADQNKPEQENVKNASFSGICSENDDEKFSP